MSSTTKAEVYQKLKEAFPKAAKITISYSGSGDDFGDFWRLEAEESDGKELKISESDFRHITEDYMFDLLDNSDADFNNDGSEGTIEFDLENMVTTLDNYEIYMETRATGVKYF